MLPYIVSDRQVVLIAKASLSISSVKPITDKTISNRCALLVKENYASYITKYTPNIGEFADTVFNFTLLDRFENVQVLVEEFTTIELLKLVQNYKYLSCDSPTWLGSEAQLLCETLTNNLIMDLDGYEEASGDIS